MSARLTIANHYLTAGMKEEAQQEFDEAVDDLRDLVVRFEGSIVEKNARAHIAQAYVMSKNWAKAFDELLVYGEKYRGLVAFGDGAAVAALRQAVAIAIHELNNPTKAKEGLERIIAYWPDTPLAESAQQEIQRLDQ
jgi:hypothetical protein